MGGTETAADPEVVDADDGGGGGTVREGIDMLEGKVRGGAGSAMRSRLPLWTKVALRLALLPD